MNLERQDWVLIQRYVTGNATVEESHRIEQWMSRNPENEKLIRDLKEIWNLTPQEDFDIDVQKAWNQFRLRKKKGARILQLHTAPEKKSYAIYHVFRSVAFILVAVVASYFFYFMSINDNQINHDYSYHEYENILEFSTNRGERARLTFSDGTEVTLNSSSSISFPQEFRGSTRNVYLEGEAYFKVVNNPNQPFVVHASHIDVEVIGTEFNVQGWSSEGIVDVVVRKGKVSVKSLYNSIGNELLLTDGYKASVYEGLESLTSKKVNVINHLLWMSGGIYFDNDSLEYVFRQLERRFDVEIYVLDSDILNIPYTGTFQYADIDEILSVIKNTLNISVEKIDRFEYSVNLINNI